MLEIRDIGYEVIGPIWADELWPGRELIEPVSAMLYQNGHDMSHFNLLVRYYGLFKDDVLIGVNSGHMCADDSFRSRGLWVTKAERGKMYGTKLLHHTIAQAYMFGATFCWSFPRKASWPTYASAGFRLTSKWVASDTSDANAFCRVDL